MNGKAMEKHQWSYEDDYVCCRKYLEYVFEDETVHRLSEMVEALHLKLPHIAEGSIRMKLQNIKQVALDSGLEDSLDISPLSQYSVQCMQAFNAATDDLADKMNKQEK